MPSAAIVLTVCPPNETSVWSPVASKSIDVFLAWKLMKSLKLIFSSPTPILPICGENVNPLPVFFITSPKFTTAS